ncbi:MAG: hypothetical protein RIK87_20425 [Fuerstiella sp.]
MQVSNTTCAKFVITAVVMCLDHVEGSQRQVVSLIDQDGYHVRLVIAERPSLGHGNWLIVEAENRTGEHDYIDAIDLRIEYTMKQPHGPDTELSSSIRVPVFKLPHGEKRSTLRLARGSTKSFSVGTEMSTRLGHQKNTHMEVEATTNCSILLSHGDGDPFRTRKLETPRKGVPVRFYWHGIDEAETAAIVREMQFLIRHFRADTQESAVTQRRMAMLLQTLPVAAQLTDDELLKLAESQNYLVAFESMRCLFERDAGYKPYIKAYAERLAGWRQVYEMHRTGFWHPDLFDALIDRAESPHDDGNTNSFHVSSMALRVLKLNRDSWGSDPAKVSRYNAARRTYRTKYYLNEFGRITVLGVIIGVAAVFWRRRRRRTIRPPPQTPPAH